MKKSINIGLILFLLLQACSGPENSENQIINEPSPQDTSVNSSVKPGNPPPPPAGNNPPPPPAGNNPDRDDEKNTGSWYDLSIYEYSPSYSVATSNGTVSYTHLTLPTIYSV